MKNKILSLIMLIFVMQFAINCTLADEYNTEDTTYHLYINDDEIVYDTAEFGNVVTISIDTGDRTFAPIRVLSENLGYAVDWNQQSQKIILTGRGESIAFKVGFNEIKNNLTDEVIKTIDIPAFVDENTNRTYLPVRAIGEALGYEVVFFQSASEYNENLPKDDCVIQFIGNVPTSIDPISILIKKHQTIPDTIALHPLGDAIYNLIEKNLIANIDSNSSLDDSFTRGEIAVIIDKLTYGFDTENNYQLLDNYIVNRHLISYALKDESQISQNDHMNSLYNKNIISSSDPAIFMPDKKASRVFIADIFYNLIVWASDKHVKEPYPHIKVTIDQQISKLYTTDRLVLDKANFLRTYNVISDSFVRDIKRDTIVSKAEFAVLLNNLFDFELHSITQELPTYSLIEGEYISQLHPVYAPVGCEATALLMALKSKGYAADVTLKDFLDAMPKTTENPEKGFVGSPYVPDLEKKTRTTIFPPILTEFASDYGNVVNISGYDADAIKGLVLRGHPVIAYMTLYYEKPYYRTYYIENNYIEYLSNNHIVMIAGYDSEAKSYYIRDPYNINDQTQPLEYWISEDSFDPIYNERKHALVVY